MGDAFIFGAGASTAYRGAKGPLFTDGEFFGVLDELSEAWADTRATDPHFGVDGRPEHYDGARWNWPRLETHLLQLCGPNFRSLGLEATFAAVDGASPWDDLFCRGIELALFWRLRAGERQNVSTHVEYLKRVLRPGATIITFNHDPVLEIALGQLGRETPQLSWHPSDGYKLNFEGELDTGGGTHSIEAKRPSNLSLLKLHGSMNWMVPAGEWPSRPRYLLRLRGVGDFGGPGFRCVREQGTGSVMRPLFVPPRRAKDYERAGLTDLWTLSEQAMRSADSLAVIGYRFPRTDEAALSLVNLASDHLRESDSVTYVTLGDSDASATFAARFTKARIFTQGFEDYARVISRP